MSKSVFTVSGMSCEHCVAAVTEEVSKLDGVSNVEVDLGAGQVALDADAPVDPEQFAAAIDEAGYEVVG